MPEIGNTVSPVGAAARRASEPPKLRSGERAGSVFGRTVSRNPTPPERLSASVRELRSETPGRNTEFDAVLHGRAGPNDAHVYEEIDGIVDATRRVPLGDARASVPATRESATASSRASSPYSALRPPPLPQRPATGLRNRRVLPGPVPPGQLGISVRAHAPQAERSSAAGAAYRGGIDHHAASPESSPRIAEHHYATLEPPEPYETPAPTSHSGLERFGRYLVNMIEQGRISRELKGDLETALVYADRLDSDLARLAELTAKTETGVALSSAERDELHSITAANTAELSRMQGLLDGCSKHSGATDEAQAFVQGLKARLAQGQARLEELAARPGEGRIGQDRAAAPIALDGFVAAAARSRRADAHVTLTADGTGAAIRTGRFARWRGERRTAGNKATAERFLGALRSAYGEQVAEAAGNTAGVQRALKSGGALQARHINEAVYRANRLAAEYRDANERLAAMYAKPDESTGGLSLTGIKIDDEARRIARGHGPRGTASLVSASVVADKVSAAIRRKGDGGKRLVTTDDARQILDTVVRRELLAAYEVARTGAMARLSLDDPASMARRSLATAATAQDVPLDPERLEPGAVDALTRRMDEAVRSLDAASLGRDAALREIAEEVAGDFVAERARSRAAVLESGLEGAARERIADQVVHDGTPAALVTHMAAACVAGEADIRRLGDRMDATETETVLVNLHDGMMKAVVDSGVEIGPENRNHVYGQFWRLLLAPGGRERLDAIADRFEPGDSLREFTEGLGWIMRRFPMSAEGSRAITYNDQGEMEIAGKPIADVSEYLVLMENLSNVLSNAVGRPGEIDDPDSLDSLSAETLGLLRRIDAPLPRRWANPEVAP